ncbi:putative iron-regulated membrane protein [Kitasatospora sp. SolWspMP-SS2h]|uniref:PepSY-associated TM helix domain-containing protein n=1 Tax=Kitasatospora sp. SolWspMP-SS2h TaxID=1305729 RepID=UPI000DB9D8AA|nr:PepSY domain-containing protein [Kitasatospora sp. SolWspMP-SS2h]RAJ32050.1 putative iron-regulated membrane protein [Kitasatospora sp. SolWspMP-SS2h]
MSSTTEQRPSDAPAPGAGEAAPTRSWGALRPLLARLHFYAGILVAPFLLVAAVTGLLYTFTPQLERFVYASYLTVDHPGGDVKPLAEQVAAARSVYPDGTLASVITPPGPDDTTRVVLSLPELGDKQRTVFVDPYTAQVKGDLTTWFGSTPLSTWLDDLHRNLHLGEVGRLYSETAASWLWVVVLGGLALWLSRARGQRAATARGVLLPDRSARGVRRTRSWHAVTGVWLALGLLFLSATGLTWSHYAGGRFGRLLDAAKGHAPELDATLPGTTAPAATGGEHAGHEGHTGTTGNPADPNPAAFQAALTTARAAGLGGTVTITAPDGPGTAWTVAQSDNTWPVHYDQVAVDTSTNTVTDRTRWADYPLLAKLSKLGVQGHMGRLFGLVNELVLAALAIGLSVITVLGYRMWWQRRPTRADRTARVGKAPARGTWRQLPLPALLVGVPLVIALGWVLPVLGVTLAAFLVGDLAYGLVLRRRSATG